MRNNSKTIRVGRPYRFSGQTIRRIAEALLASASIAASTGVAHAQDVIYPLTEVGGSKPGFKITSNTISIHSGSSVSGAGDVNGDGLDDLIVGAPGASAGPLKENGSSFIVFGKRGKEPVDLDNLGTSGFAILGASIYDRSGSIVSSAGDVNGDGLADVIVHCQPAYGDGVIGLAEAFVVFGKKDSQTVDLSEIGTSGFRIAGDRARDFWAWHSASGAGDFNGDGLSDVIIGWSNSPGYTGSVFVVFGKADPAPVDLTDLGPRGLEIRGRTRVEGMFGQAVSAAGDVDGDGLDDVMIGAPREDVGESYSRENRGKAFVIFGKTGNEAVDVATLGTQGFSILGDKAGDGLGFSLSGCGDLNGDGMADVIAGSPWIHFTTSIYATGSGGAYVVFGGRRVEPVLTSELGDNGFPLVGYDPVESAGCSLSSVGDRDGDGLADLLIGTGMRQIDGSKVGGAYIVPGKGDSNPVDLRIGTVLLAAPSSGAPGRSVSGAGDVNGDGFPDLIIGAPDYGASERKWAGESYVVFGSPIEPASSTYRAFARAGDAPRLAIGVAGDGTNSNSPDSRAWIDFAGGAGGGRDGSSLQTVSLRRSSAGLTGGPALLADVAWQLSTDRGGFGLTAVTFKYTDREIEGLVEADLRLYKSASSSGPWSALNSTVDAERNTINAEVSGFGYFLIGQPGATPTPTATPVATPTVTPTVTPSPTPSLTTVIDDLLGYRSSDLGGDRNGDGILDAADLLNSVHR